MGIIPVLLLLEFEKKRDGYVIRLRLSLTL